MICFRHCRYCAVENCVMRITDEVICDHYKQKKQTNADRIRSMTDEELAAWIEEITEDITPNWLDWLKQEVTTNSTT